MSISSNEQAGEITPSIIDIQPRPEHIAITQAVASLALELGGGNAGVPVSDAIYETTEFILYWRLWQEIIQKAVRLHAHRWEISEPVDSFVELEMLLGGTGYVSNVNIFHTDMTTAALLPNHPYTSQVQDSHNLTERIITVADSERQEGFWVFAQERQEDQVKRSLYVLADNAPTELIDLEEPSELPGYKFYPGNISDGEYIFGSRDLPPSEFAEGKWTNWQQALPWRFVDLTGMFHRAPSDTSSRDILLRLNTYIAPARNPEHPFSIRVPLFKLYPRPEDQ